MKRYFLLADLHGQHYKIDNFYRNYDEIYHFTTEDVVIILGDSGLNYYNTGRDHNIKKKLCKYPFEYFIIRGNHELRLSQCECCNFIEEKKYGNIVYYEEQFPQIKYATDCPNFYIFGDKKVLVIPSAYSVDKFFRLERGMFWNEQEQITEQEKNKLLCDIKDYGNKVDYILAHTCPRSFEPFIQDLFLPAIDQSKVDKSMEMFLDTIIDLVEYDRFYFGHYHDNRDISTYKGTMIFDQPLELGDFYYNHSSYIK